MQNPELRACASTPSPWGIIMALCCFTCLSSDEHIACVSCKRRKRGRDGPNANRDCETKQNAGLKSDSSRRSHSNGWTDIMSHSCHARDFLNLCAETAFQRSLNLTFPDVNSFQTSWLFEACPSGAGLVFSPAADREQRFGGRLDGFKYEMRLPSTTLGAVVKFLRLPDLQRYTLVLTGLGVNSLDLSGKTWVGYLAILTTEEAVCTVKMVTMFALF